MSKAKDIILNCYPWNLEESITRLNYLINGTGNYWRRGSNKRIFSKMDSYIVNLWIRRIKRWYPNKSIKWMIRKHFKESTHPGYHDKWTFTDPKSNKQVDKMSWISIRYHKCIKYKATPYDREYDEYFEKRLLKRPFEYLFG